MSETGNSEVTAGTPSPELLGSDVDDALKFDPSWSIACVPSPPFDRATIARHWKAMKEEIKRLRLEVERLQNTGREAR
jgi:hypothetical protein